MSERYAKGSSGNVYGFVEGSWEGSIFNTVEYPALKSNPNIENIFIGIYKNEKLIYLISIPGVVTVLNSCRVPSSSKTE